MRKPINSDSYLLNADPDPQTHWIATFLLRGTGYILLILAILDIVALFIPPQFLDPTWEFETIGKVVARAPVPLIGFVLIFYGGTRYRKAIERLCLRPLALLGVVFGVGLMLLAPLVIMDGIRVNHKAQIDYSEQQAQQDQTFAAIREQIQKTPTQNLMPLAQSLNMKISVNPQSEAELKEDILGQLGNRQAAALKKAKNSQQKELKGVFKNMVKWAIGALLSGFGLVYLGRGALRLFKLSLS